MKGYNKVALNEVKTTYIHAEALYTTHIHDEALQGCIKGCPLRKWSFMFPSNDTLCYILINTGPLNLQNKLTSNRYIQIKISTIDFLHSVACGGMQ